MATNFYLDLRTDKKGDAAIRMRVVVKGTRMMTTAGLKIAPAKWDAARQQVRKGSSNSAGLTWSTINAMLSRIAEHFARYENECISAGIEPTLNDLKAELAKALSEEKAPVRKKERAPGFFDYFDRFVAERGEASQWSLATFNKFRALRKQLKEFRPRIKFDEIDEKRITAFMSFLRTAKGQVNSTIAKQLGYLRWFLRWATLKGYNTNTAFRDFSPKLKTAQKKVVFLEWDELMRVYQYELPPNGTDVVLKDYLGHEYIKTVREAGGIAKTRDIFCFCCFTSLRYSDAQNLKRADIRDGKMTITTVKTADTITIELNKYAKAILARYAERTDLEGYVFPRITNQRMNSYLKDLCELCGLNEPITETHYRGSERFDETFPKYALIGTHTGRRTFICNALMLGIPAEIVMKWTGHADYSAMRPYIDIANSAKEREMNKFNNL